MPVFRSLGSALLAAFIAGNAHAAGAQKYALCQGNPDLNQVGFTVSFNAADLGPTKTWHYKFHHCALAGRTSAQPMEVQRYYTDGEGNGLGITTQMGSLVSSVRLLSMDSKPRRHADMGLYFTSELLSGFNNNFYPATLYQGADESGKVPGSLKIETVWE